MVQRYRSWNADADATPSAAWCEKWSADSVDRLWAFFEKEETLRASGPIRFEGEYVGYDDDNGNMTAILLDDLRDFEFRGHWGVLGSQSPWIEAYLLSRGVDQVAEDRWPGSVARKRASPTGRLRWKTWPSNGASAAAPSRRLSWQHGRTR